MFGELQPQGRCSFQIQFQGHPENYFVLPEWSEALCNLNLSLTVGVFDSFLFCGMLEYETLHPHPL